MLTKRNGKELQSHRCARESKRGHVKNRQLVSLFRFLLNKQKQQTTGAMTMKVSVYSLLSLILGISSCSAFQWDTDSRKNAGVNPGSFKIPTQAETIEVLKVKDAGNNIGTAKSDFMTIKPSAKKDLDTLFFLSSSENRSSEPAGSLKVPKNLVPTGIKKDTKLSLLQGSAMACFSLGLMAGYEVEVASIGALVGASIALTEGDLGEAFRVVGAGMYQAMALPFYALASTINGENESEKGRKSKEAVNPSQTEESEDEKYFRSRSSRESPLFSGSQPIREERVARRLLRTRLASNLKETEYARDSYQDEAVQESEDESSPIEKEMFFASSMERKNLGTFDLSNVAPLPRTESPPPQASIEESMPQEVHSSGDSDLKMDTQIASTRHALKVKEHNPQIPSTRHTLKVNEHNPHGWRTKQPLLGVPRQLLANPPAAPKPISTIQNTAKIQLRPGVLATRSALRAIETARQLQPPERASASRQKAVDAKRKYPTTLKQVMEVQPKQKIHSFAETILKEQPSQSVLTRSVAQSSANTPSVGKPTSIDRPPVQKKKQIQSEQNQPQSQYATKTEKDVSSSIPKTNTKLPASTESQSGFKPALTLAEKRKVAEQSRMRDQGNVARFFQDKAPNQHGFILM